MTAPGIARRGWPRQAIVGAPSPGWTPASRRELVALAVYFLGVISITDVLNVRLGVEAMTAVVVLPALFTGRFRAFTCDWWVFLLGLVLWNLSGAVAAQTPFTAHLDFMLDADRFLFAGHDPVVLIQHTLAPTTGVTALDWPTAITYNLHVQEPYIAGYFLWRLSRTVYFQFVAAALILLVLGFVTFILFPAVPPWMAATRLGRLPYITNRFGPVIHANPLPFHGTPLFYLLRLRGDAVAAFPSEHAAFPTLELIAFARAAGRITVVFFGIWVAWVLFTIVYLGEHWVIDAIAGYLYAVCIFAFVVWFTARRRQRPSIT